MGVEEFEEYNELDSTDSRDEVLLPKISDEELPKISDEDKEIIKFFKYLDKKRARYKTNKRISPECRQNYYNSVDRTSKYNYSLKQHIKPGLFRSEINRNINIRYDKKNENQDVDNLLTIVTEFLDLPEFMANRAKFLLAKTWNNEGQKKNYNNMKYDMAALGILMYCCDDLYEDSDFDLIRPMFEEYVKLLYPRLNRETNLNQIKQKIKDLNRAYKRIKQLCTIDPEKEAHPICESQVDIILNPSEKLNLMINYRNHSNINKETEEIERIEGIYRIWQNRKFKLRQVIDINTS
jgi:hypothetical protein